MARAQLAYGGPEQLAIHEDDMEDEEVLDESRGPLEESGCTIDDSEEDEEPMDETVAEDMARFEEGFKELGRRYRLINRIGEGTFSTVYKAEDLHYDHYRNDWDVEERENRKWASPGGKRDNKLRSRFVAIKKIYVTSSPLRILNELELLHDLRDSEAVCPLITAFRHNDQVIAILPYFQHRDFRDYFRDMKVSEMRLYFRSLFTALQSVHAHNILHRDIKPTNFLYSPQHARGSLVDFGLAERQGTDWHLCTCQVPSTERSYRIQNSVWGTNKTTNPQNQAVGYPKSDQRSSRRANRAGTRGFRAPEVLLKCTAQSTSIDMWSAGVILLTLLARRFPFFHSADDIDALLELTNIFGRRKMQETALLHGQVFETTIPSYSDKGHDFEKIILWCTNRSTRDDQGRRIHSLTAEEKEAVGFLKLCLECDPAKRITAEDALRHPFIVRAGEGELDDDMIDLVSP